jgi:hypothetical protein
MFGYINQSKVDKPDQVLFAKEIAKHIPNKDDSNKFFYSVVGAFVAGKAIKGARRNK